MTTLYIEGFESYGNGSPPSTPPWSAIPPSIIAKVSSTISHSGSKSLKVLVNQNTRVEKTIMTNDMVSMWVYVDILGSPTIVIRTEDGTGFSNAYFSPAANQVDYGTSGAIVHSGVPCVAGMWHHVEISHNYTARTYSLWVDSTLVASNVPFWYGLVGASEGSAILFFGPDTGVNAYIDDIEITGVSGIVTNVISRLRDAGGAYKTDFIQGEELNISFQFDIINRDIDTSPGGIVLSLMDPIGSIVPFSTNSAGISLPIATGYISTSPPLIGDLVWQIPILPMVTGNYAIVIDITDQYGILSRNYIYFQIIATSPIITNPLITPNIAMYNNSVLVQCDVTAITYRATVTFTNASDVVVYVQEMIISGGVARATVDCINLPVGIYYPGQIEIEALTEDGINGDLDQTLWLEVAAAGPSGFGVDIWFEDVSGTRYDLTQNNSIYFDKMQLGETKKLQAFVKNRDPVRPITSVVITPIAHPTDPIGSPTDTYEACTLSLTETGTYSTPLVIGTIGAGATQEIWIAWAILTTTQPGWGFYALKAEGVYAL